MDGNRVLLHHVFHLGNRRTGNHLFQREYTAQTFIVVYHIYIIYLVHFFCLQSHFAQAFGHTPVLVHNHHFRTHQTTGGVFVVFQQVDDVACLFDVFNVRKHLFLLVLVHFTDDVYGIVRIHVVDKALGDGFRGKYFEEFLSCILVHFNQYVGCRFVVQQQVDEAGIFCVQLVAQLGDVGRMQVLDDFF